MAKHKDPETRAEWQEAVDMADALLTIDSARMYGLIEGGPECNAERCMEILALAAKQGIAPSPTGVERVIDAFTRTC